METTEAVRERPILFSAPMIRAILDGTKTQTRRVVKPQPEPWMVNGYPVDGDGCGGTTRRGPSSEELLAALTARCPYGQPGDRLWVRETWAAEAGLDTLAPGNFHHWPVWYRADDSYDTRGGFHTGQPRGRWRPSIHMPRWASRITLEITDVRVERVQEITREDAIAEGISHACDVGPRECFRDLWDSINAGRGYPFAANAWVWAVHFRRLEAPE